jgi:hypothetical protein
METILMKLEEITLKQMADQVGVEVARKIVTLAAARHGPAAEAAEAERELLVLQAAWLVLTEASKVGAAINVQALMTARN